MEESKLEEAALFVRCCAVGNTKKANPNYTFCEICILHS